MAVIFRGAHFPKEVILMGVRWYVAYLLSTRHIEELMEERGVELERDEQAAKRILTQAIRRHGVPEAITIDGSEAQAAAIRSYNKEHGTAITIRQVKYLNNNVKQDHRAVKRMTRPMLGLKSLDAAQCTLAGVELMHMLKKRQMMVAAGDEGLTTAEQLYTSAA
jgi:putative transposase